LEVETEEMEMTETAEMAVAVMIETVAADSNDGKGGGRQHMRGYAGS
jgi:hypothetical protein